MWLTDCYREQALLPQVFLLSQTFQFQADQRLEGSPAGSGSLLRQCGREFQ